MSNPRAVTYRPMTEGDLGATTYVRRAAMESLDSGATPSSWTPAFPRTQAHLLRTDPDGCIIAEIDGVVVGFAQGWVRGDIWFLAQLFVQPEVHSLGIGGALLARAKVYGEARGARVFSVVSTAQPVSQALYMRHGMFAIGIGYRMTGDLAPLRQLPEPAATKKTIVDLGVWQDSVAKLDRSVFGAERRDDHGWYLAGGASTGSEASFGLTRDGELVAYGYAIEDGGHIAPIAAYEPADQLPMLRMSAEWLLDREVGTGMIWVLSQNSTMMSALLDAGWRIGAWTFLLASDPFAEFDRYHPAGGILL